MRERPTLLIVPNLEAVRDPGGDIRITRKFLEGAAIYARLWPGSVRVWMGARNCPTTNLDEMVYEPGTWPFELEIAPPHGAEADKAISDADIVLASIGFGHDDLPARSSERGTPCVLVTEYTLRTRLQIAAAEETNVAKRLRRKVWERGQERRNLAAVRAASGVQANGTPTYDAYRRENTNTLLYFDSRLTEEMLASEEDVASRPIEGPLRLAFSGRFIAMKGVDHLVPVARHLADAGLEFQLDLFGDGPLADQIRTEIDRIGLSDRVSLHGVLDFGTELVPTMSNGIELFVCPHRQGDPSCTYLETMGCGVPIVGYDNEAFAGLQRESGLGWTTPCNDPDALAERILELARDRVALREAGSASLQFARTHAFEQTFQRRVQHLHETLAKAG
jgi:colanic acid/amylovoran biosynthesis glycosyltransferase